MPRVQVDVKDSDLPIDHDQDPDQSQYYYTPEEIQRLISDPEYHLAYRKEIEYGINMGFSIFYKNSPASKMAEAYMIEAMKRRLKNHPELCERLIPKWPVGCRYVVDMIIDVNTLMYSAGD
jgi:hypothetical protein